jgi:amino acid adenylation domain-containing protein
MRTETGTVTALVEAQSAARPSAVAVEQPDGETWTYAELSRRVGQIAATLRPLYVTSAPAVAVDLPDSLDFCATVLAVLGSGATLLALDQAQPPARLATMLSTVGPQVVVTDRPGGAAATWAATADCSPRIVDLARLGGAPQAGDGWGPGPDGPDTPAYIIFTSGTTGVPKATVNTHAGLFNHLVFMRDVCALPEGSRVLLKSARTFDAWLLEFFWAFIQGVTLVLAAEGRATDAQYLATTLTKKSIHGFVCVPSLLQRVFSVLERTGETTDLKVVISAGEPLKAGLAWRILASTDARLFNLYGPAEAAIDVAYHQVTGPSVTDPIPIGRAIPGNRLTVRDPAGADITASGAKGELVVTGVHVGLGYAGDAAATAAKFGSDDDGSRAYATGDLAYLGPDENFYVGGRMDTQVKINGVRIETGEIEAVLMRHETVADCSVQVTESTDVPVLVAFIEAQGDAPPASVYINYLRGLLPPVMVPPMYAFLTEFKTLPSGKKDTSALVFPRGLPTVTATEFEAPDGPAEEELAKIWESVLGVAPIGAVDDFSLVGGDSLKMIDIMVKISESVYPDIFSLGITRLTTVRDLTRKIQTSAG